MKLTVAPILLVAVLLAPPPLGGQTRAGADRLAAERAKYVGLEHRPLPAGLKDLGGALIGPVAEPQYGLALIARGRTRMLWLSRLTRRDEAGRPTWEVRDVLFLPAVGRGEVLAYALCFSNGKPDPEIVAIAAYERDREFFTRIRRAWRADRREERFESVPAKGIKCEHEGYGV